jgi:predicted dithiol-disulfide oxidoreductase (DUF899 family)
MQSVHFPGESPDYRRAREELLRAEVELRRHVEAVAAARRKLPLGGVVPEDYVFEEGGRKLDDMSPPHAVRLSELFAPGKDSLVVYSFMFSSEMERACRMCSAFLDALNGNARHIEERANLAVVAKSPIERIRAFARTRPWPNLRLLSSQKNTFNRDYFGDAADGSQNTVIHTFVKRGGQIHHSYSSELAFVPSDAGQNQRHIDLMWPLWNVLDLTPEGRGTDWLPQLTYPASPGR